MRVFDESLEKPKLNMGTRSVLNEKKMANQDAELTEKPVEQIKVRKDIKDIKLGDSIINF